MHEAYPVDYPSIYITMHYKLAMPSKILMNLPCKNTESIEVKNVKCYSLAVKFIIPIKPIDRTRFTGFRTISTPVDNRH